VSVAEAYLESRVMSAKPYQLHLMVVEGAIRFARQGLQGLEANDLEVTHFSLNRSRDCVNELVTGMNADVAPEIAANLRSLFVYAVRCLTLADSQRNPQLIQDALQVLEGHRDTWLETIQRFQTENPEGAPAGETLSGNWVG